MNSEALLSARIDALETHAMQQDRVVEDLHAALTAQWRILDGLSRQIATLDERIQEFGKTPGDAPAEGPPPHY